MGLSLKHDDDNMNNGSGNVNNSLNTSFKDMEIPQNDADIENLLNRVSEDSNNSSYASTGGNTGSSYNTNSTFGSNSGDNNFSYNETPYIDTTLYSDLKSVQKALDAKGIGTEMATTKQMEAQGKKMFIWTCVLIVGLMIVGGIIIQKKVFLQRAHTTEGEITKVVRKHSYYRRRGGSRVRYDSYVGYEVNGVYYERYWNTTPYGLTKGMVVTVYYNPAHPGEISNGQVMTFDLWFALIAVLVAIGFCGVLSYKAYHGEDISRYLKGPKVDLKNSRTWRF